MSRSIALLLALTALTACQREPAAPLLHEAYVWQQQWTPALDAALGDAAPTFAGYRVLVAESDRDARLATIAPDLAALARAQRPLVAVVRLDGSVPPPDARALAGALAGVVRDWRAAGLALSGVEIDRDCAGAQLEDYARWLREFRRDSPDLKLSIGALPEWIDAAALARLLAAADDSVLQIAGTPAAQQGRFDASAARHSIEAYARAASKPFRVAVPAYDPSAPADRDGAAATSASPAASDPERGAKVAQVAPDTVAKLLRGLERDRPARLVGLVWFRLPTSEDPLAWNLATLRAVIAGDPLRPVVQVSFDKDETGANDLVLANRGAVDAPLPPAIVIAAFGCDAGDAHEGYRLERSGDDWRFVATARNVLSAGRQQQVGWLRCDVIGGVKIDETARAAPAN